MKKLMENNNMNFKKLSRMQLAALFIIFIMVVSGVAGFLIAIFG
jgi:hypothetical protein